MSYTLEIRSDRGPEETYPVAVCYCGHSVHSHAPEAFKPVAPGELSEACEGCACDGEDFQCSGFSLFGWEDEEGDITEALGRPNAATGGQA